MLRVLTAALSFQGVQSLCHVTGDLRESVCCQFLLGDSTGFVAAIQCVLRLALRPADIVQSVRVYEPGKCVVSAACFTEPMFTRKFLDQPAKTRLSFGERFRLSGAGASTFISFSKLAAA